VQSANETYCDTDRCLVVEKFTKSLGASEQAARNFYVDRFNLRKIHELEISKKEYNMIKKVLQVCRT